MNKYIDGYLASIPKSEQQRIHSFVENILKSKISLNEYYSSIENNPEFVEYRKILDELKIKSTTTEAVNINDDGKTYETYNEFFKKVYIDLIYLYQIIEAMYSVKENYHSLISSYINDISNEVKKLENKLFELQTRNTIPYGHYILNETFINSESFHSSKDTVSNNDIMFIDRDGTATAIVDNVHYNNEDMICLNTIESNDMIHNESGKSLALIELLDYRGVPITTFNTIENAIDMSNFTYWDCSTITNEQIRIKMDGYEEGGAYVKIKITLPKIKPISEIALEPFCSKPVEVCSIKINGVKYGDNTTKVHEILNEYENKNNESISTMIFNFTQVSGDYIEIVLRQKNYTIVNQEKKDKYKIAEALFKDALGEKTISYITGEENIHDLFENTYEKEMIEWNEEYVRNL